MLTLVLGLALVVGALQAPARATADDPTWWDRGTTAPVRLLPFGDSITVGTAGDWTWRYFLDRHLRAAQQPFDMVGPARAVHDLEGWGWTPDYADPEFDQDHAGWWGNSLAWRWDPGPSDLVAAHAPDVVLFAAGTNDVGFWELTVRDVLGRVSQWVESARRSDPGVAIVLLEIPATYRDAFATYNALLGETAESLSTTQSPVVVARTAEGYRTSEAPFDGGDTWDHVHPNSRGAQKMAAAVADALAELGIGKRYPRPLPHVPEGPPEVPTLTATPEADGGRLRLDWSAVSGATAVQLEHRTDTGAWLPWGSPVDVRTERGTRVAGLEECVTHDFRVRSVKLWTLADERFASRPVSHRWSGTMTEPPEVAVSTGGDGAVLTWPPVPHACSVAVTVRRAYEGHLTSETRHEVLDGRLTLQGPGSREWVELVLTPHGIDGPGPTTRLTLGNGIDPSRRLDFLVPPVTSTRVRVGVPVSVTSGSWSAPPEEVVLQWLRDGQEIPAAVGTTYRPVAADLGASLAVRVGVRAGDHEGTALVRAGRVRLGAAPRWRGPAPRLAGRDRVGARIRLAMSPARVRKRTQSPDAALSYQWLRGGAPIPTRARARSYVLRKADRGTRLRVRITVVRAGHAPRVVTSRAVRIR